MGYLHINNLYKDQTILMFREAYALEKIHGTSAHLTVEYVPCKSKWDVRFFSGGESHDRFVGLFSQGDLEFRAGQLGIMDKPVTFYGEAYGGKQQGMSATYGKDLKFIVFDVKVGEHWLDVPKAELLAHAMGLEFVSYQRIATTIAEMDAQRDLPSVQAKRNGIVEDKLREGVVLRPIVEVTLNNGSRVIAKHKRDEFRETATPRVVDDPAKLKLLEDAKLVAEEWVTHMRLTHVLDKLPEATDMKYVPQVIAAMTEDVLREGAGEIVDSKEVRKAISSKAVELFKNLLKSKLGA